MKHISLPYQGYIQAMAGQDNKLLMVTTHPEKKATALYQINMTGKDTLNMESVALPCGGHDIVCLPEQLWIAGQDGKLYYLKDISARPKAFKSLDFADQPIIRLAAMAHHQLALLQKNQLSLLNTKNGQLQPTHQLEDEATAIAADPSGQWLAVGLRNGMIAVYQYYEGRLQRSEQAIIHQGRVSALAFEPNELRFYSAGADKKLFSLHAQGTLQAIDKGRSSQHDGTINHILRGNTRFFTGGSDKSIKAWGYGGGRPLTLNKGLHKVTHLACITYENKQCLIAAGTDNSLRFIPLQSDEQLGEVYQALHDAYEWAKTLLADTDPARTQKALALLKQFDDQKGFEVLEKTLQQDRNKAIRRNIIQIAGESSHPAARKLLENALTDKQADVRMDAFQAACQRIPANSLRPYTLALDSGHVDIGTQAIKALSLLAKKETVAEHALLTALGHPQHSIALLALSELETVYAKNNPDASLQALQIEQPALQRAALIRLYQRQLLTHKAAQRALVLAQENQDAWVRHSAFLVAIAGQPALAQALKVCEPGLARQLQALEDFDLLSQAQHTEGSASTKETGSDAQKTQQSTRPKKAAPPSKKRRTDALKKLNDQALTPLLQSMTSRHADICFNAAFALAALQDQRALGLLLLLAQEQDDGIRVGVCQAFALLQQADARLQLAFMLDDSSPTVRDAAFSALHSLSTTPWATIKSGFATQYEDIHTRALKMLLDALTVQKTQSPESEQLLRDALDNPFSAIRQETFKFCLNRQVANQRSIDTNVDINTDMDAMLQLLLSSTYENVHQEVLNELLAGVKQKQSHALTALPRLFADPFQAVRQTALAEALKNKKQFMRDEVLSQAVKSPFVDIRQQVLKQISSKPTQHDQALLQTLLNDEDDALRLSALQAVISHTDKATLQQALDSRFTDIRIQSALACARLGMEAAYQPLLALVTAEKPVDKKDHAYWQEKVLMGLQGLAELADPRAFDTVLNKVLSGNKKAAEQASHALPWVSTAGHINALQPLLQNEQPLIRANSALALALLGDTHGQQILKDKALDALLNPIHKMAALLAAGPVDVSQWRPWLESETTPISSWLVLLSHELLLHGEQPTLTTRALSIPNAAFQRVCADWISDFQDVPARWASLQQVLSAHLTGHDKTDWRLPMASLEAITAVLVHGSNHLRTQLLGLLTLFDQQEDYKQWQAHYQAFSQRYAQAIKAAQAAVKTTDPDSRARDAQQQLAFGAYLGLLRDNERTQSASGTPPARQLNIQRQAISGLSKLAQKPGSSLQHSVCSALLTLLNHPDYSLRQKAYSDLLNLDITALALGEAALSARHEDITQAGLSLLVAEQSTRKAQQLLTDLLLNGSNSLAQQAYQLLKEDAQVGLVKIAPHALESRAIAVRIRCVTDLGQHYHSKETTESSLLGITYKRSDIPKQLLDACENRYKPAAFKALQLLAQHQHPQATQRLQALWINSESEQEQRRLLTISLQMTTAEVAEFLSQCVMDRDTLKVTTQQVYQTIGEHRHSGLFETLLARLQPRHPDNHVLASTLLMLSGYDQPIGEAIDTDHPAADRSWLERQHPRTDDHLLKLCRALLHLDDLSLLARHLEPILQGMTWMAANAQCDQVLEEVAAVADDKVSTKRLLKAISIRARRRQGSVSALLKLLSHKQPEVQFLAAEGLARSGHSQGNNVLLAASEYLENLDERQRAIIALGESGDPEVLEKLLDLAQNSEHALQEAAVEAIGHLSRHENGAKILKLLQQSLKKADIYSRMNQRALNGLRWFNTAEAWQSIFDFIEQPTHSPFKGHALTLLRYRDSEFSRELLLKTLREYHEWTEVMAAYDSAIALWQPAADGASPVDLALIQGHLPLTAFEDDHILARISQYADTATLIHLLSGAIRAVNASVRGTLQQALLQRSDHKTADIIQGLNSERSDTVGLMAHLTALLPNIPKTLQTALQKALQTHQQRWQNDFYQYLNNPERISQQTLAQQEQTLSHLFLAVIMHQLETPLLATYLHSMQASHQRFHSPILSALLQAPGIPEATLASVQPLLSAPGQQVRRWAQHIIHKHRGFSDTPRSAATEAGSQAAGAAMQLDWQSFLAQPELLMSADFLPTVEKAASSIHYAQALPILIRKQHVDALQQIAGNPERDDNQRMGAIEALGRIRTPKAEACLQRLLEQQDNAEDLSRAAFRALRRSQRARQKESLGMHQQTGASA